MTVPASRIIGADLGSVAYGQGMMIAEDRGCTVVDQIIKVATSAPPTSAAPTSSSSTPTSPTYTRAVGRR